MAKLMPVGERCLVEEIKPETDAERLEKEHGIVMISYERNVTKPTHGKVVAVGSGPLINETLKVGDTVFFAMYAGTYVTVEGIKYRNLEINEITSVLREDEKETTK